MALGSHPFLQLGDGECEFHWPERPGPEAYSLGFFSVLMV